MTKTPSLEHSLFALRDYNRALCWQHGRRVGWTPAMQVALGLPLEETEGRDLFLELSTKPYRLKD